MGKNLDGSGFFGERRDIIRGMETKNPWREDFPAIKNNKGTIFFDNAATTQKPLVVIRSMTELWENGVTAVGRSSGKLARSQMELLEKAQSEIARFLGARSDELVITKSATEALNLVAENFCQLVNEDEKILLSVTNHHSNIAPWLRRKKDAVLRLKNNEKGLIDQRELRKILENEKVRLVSITWVSNVLGGRENLAQIAEIIKRVNQKRERQIFLVVDGAAAMLEEKINWRKIEAEALVVSGHKMYGPAIAGVLVKKELLLSGDFAPMLYGGGMLKSLNLAGEIILGERMEQRWRAGVTDLVSVVGWAAACEWLAENRAEKDKFLTTLVSELVNGLQKIPGIQLLGASERGHVVSFVYDGYATVDVMAYLASQGVLAREGLHCCQPLHESLALPSSIRLSLAHYNDIEEVTKVLQLLCQVPQVLWHEDDIMQANVAT